MKWILEHLQLIIFIIVLISMVRGAMQAAKNKPGGDEERPELPGDLEEQARMREVQERIRRKIAERRGEAAAPVAPPAQFAPAEPPPRPPLSHRPQADPLDGPTPRELLRRTYQPRVPPVVAPAAFDSATLGRQEELADQIRQLEAERLANDRRVAQLATETATVAAAYAPTKAQVAWLADLRKADNLRRAIVLREVVGPPIALR
jgi:hypothetical protein